MVKIYEKYIEKSFMFALLRNVLHGIINNKL